MQKQLKLGILLLTLLTGGAFADRPTLSVDLGAVGELPSGGFKPGPAMGGLGYLEIGTSSGVEFIATSGYVYHLKRNGITSFNQIPILGGLVLSPSSSPVYVMGELGVVLTHWQQTGDSSTVASAQDDTNLGWDVGLGSEIGPIDIRLTFNEMVVKNQRDAMSVGLLLAFRIWDNL